MSGEDRPTMPPVRLPSEAELARDALAAPLYSRAVRLARWAGAAAEEAGEEGVPVGVGGELLADRLKEAVDHLGLAGEEDGDTYTSEAWNLAVDTGLVDIDELEQDGGAAGEEKEDAPSGLATPGDELSRVSGSPEDVLALWQEGLDSVLADASTPSFEDLLGGMNPVVDADGNIDPDSIDLDAMDWNPEEEADFLDSALGNLYVLTATDVAVAAGSMVPLPVLAASMIVPDDMDEPTNEILEEVSAAMMKLDDQFRILELTGLVEYRPVDEALTAEIDMDDPEAAVAEAIGPDEEDVDRYGLVRLTPLGLHGVRVRMRDAGIEAPLVGDLAEASAATLLGAIPAYPEETARAEIEAWLAARTAVTAARELLAAARGDDADAPARRLACQQTLSLTPGTEAEPALREVLDDRELGGLARVWLAERGAGDVPPPDEDMIFWLTVDTIAAQLQTVGEAEELKGLVQGLVDQHTGFFDKVWRVAHPATGDVLEAMGRIHPDKATAKEARKAAFKARSLG
ncbi:hypothetical protein [Streptomyces sp. HNM0574]|uniref:hypothetical protein n=1 Tax=Streptomyces sp. HNM0574 TaxID=2714954 RepID=UPI00146EBF32|nr:hypothetical protein [Streptomyces sp. HNM0574]NLU67480.1 hypothetical protein [Streptomyces sp. HNM0574]